MEPLTILKSFLLLFNKKSTYFYWGGCHGSGPLPVDRLLLWVVRGHLSWFWSSPNAPALYHRERFVGPFPVSMTPEVLSSPQSSLCPLFGGSLCYLSIFAVLVTAVGILWSIASRIDQPCIGLVSTCASDTCQTAERSQVGEWVLILEVEYG